MAVAEHRHSWLKSLWIPSSMATLSKLEGKILSALKTKFVSRYVCLPSNPNKRIWTVIFNKEKQATPLVMIHGFGGGLGMWVKNIDDLAKHRPVYTFDLLGFGRSSRTPFSQDPRLAEAEFLESIEEWRSQMNLDKFVLLGHSFGAYLAAAYTLEHPNRVRHLILTDPWGFPTMPPPEELQFNTGIRLLLAIINRMGPLAPMRAMGPLGPRVVGYFRGDLQRKYVSLFDDKTMPEYIYQCNAAYPSGEQGFKTLSKGLGWAQFPMQERMEDLEPYIPVSFLYGGRSWISSKPGWAVKRMRENSFTDVTMIGGAGHHLYADEAEAFNLAVNKICSSLDANLPPRPLRIPSQRNLRRLLQGRMSQSAPGLAANPEEQQRAAAAAAATGAAGLDLDEVNQLADNLEPEAGGEEEEEGREYRRPSFHL